MNDSGGRGIRASRAVLWIARLAGTAVVALLILMVFGESGSGPARGLPVLSK